VKLFDLILQRTEDDIASLGNRRIRAIGISPESSQSWFSSNGANY